MKTNNLEACMAYLEKLPPAMSGAGGHGATFNAALACRRFGLSEGETWQAMQAFNERCQPPWSEKELKHKIESVGGVSITKRLGGQRAHTHTRPVFVAPARPAAPTVDPRPVCQQSAETEELWWANVAHELGTTLEVFDAACGVTS